MIAFQCTEFKIELTHYDISFVEENSFFSDSIFRKYSFPFRFPVEELRLLSMVDNHNISIKKKYKGTLFIDNVTEEASMQLKTINGKELEATIYFGKENIPLFEKNLKELPFYKETVSNIYEIAENKVADTDADFTFPMIFNTEVSKEEYQLDGKINIYENGTFPRNEFSGGTAILKNIVMPFPKLLYIIYKGFEMAGYSAAGNFFENRMVQQAYIVPEPNNIKEIKADINKTIRIYDYEYYQHGGNVLYFEKKFEITSMGNYTIKVKRSFDYYRANYEVTEYLRIAIVETGEPLFERTGLYPLVNHTIIYNATEEDIGRRIRFYLLTISTMSGLLLTANITNKTGLDNPYVHIGNTIDIAALLPEMTFGRLITTIKNWFNLDIDISREGEVTLNFIETITKTENAIDLSDKMPEHPLRKFSEVDCIVLKYKDIDEYKDYNFQKIKVTENATELLDYADNIEDTDSNVIINIDGVFLPMETKSGVTTAIAKDSGNILRLVLYDGLVGDKNTCVDNIEGQSLDIPALYNQFWREWLNFRIHAMSYEVNTTIGWLLNKLIDIKKMVFCYNNYFLIRKKTSKRLITDETDVTDLVKFELEKWRISNYGLTDSQYYQTEDMIGEI